MGGVFFPRHVCVCGVYFLKLFTMLFGSLTEKGQTEVPFLGGFNWQVRCFFCGLWCEPFLEGGLRFFQRIHGLIGFL